ncbi:Dabb family protein [Rhodohalobacter sulfatireducens]|uniref:Dabb family protein n=1 Tax=Rhodohalobacter sulfatireducens TaxID=2911366 RepID=A0ABS9KBN9_9BACT|nr:Dabb family protein [Rhodohalobacter sulfatireducens]MCG2588264.1 Dabb family protein [Rhodohalobacter sulfatireducens]MDR9364808.1 Dabb family protein [Balneolaceae bacterium]MDR9408092.1 Dabb family protein [Balneolaceae bacterium]
MIRHIVMWKLKENAAGATKKKNAEKLKLILEGLRANIEEIKAVEVGIQINGDEEDSLDVVLTCDFETELDFQMYTRNPHHKKAIDFIEEVADERFFVDYKVDL